MIALRFILSVALILSTTAWCADAFWEATLKDEKKGDVILKLSEIQGVALHTYKLDGTIEITECTIDTKGSHSIRFYAIASSLPPQIPQTSATRTALNEVKKRAEVNTSYPARKFPEGAYSHNIEYQLSSPEKVYKVFKSIKDAWHQPASTTTIKNIDQ